jgi:phosphoglycolate phosphatase-like HAD superfamily hydrolase
MSSLIFDLDRTLVSYNGGLHLFPQIRELLEALHQKGYPLYVASFNPFAKFILKHFQILKYFQGVAKLVSLTSKPDLIFRLAQEQGFDPCQTWMFDDDSYNVSNCRAVGLCITKVDPLIGVTETQVYHALSRM